MISIFLKLKLFILFLFICSLSQSQNINNIYSLSLDEIEESFVNLKKEEKKIIAPSYLLRAKKERNTSKIANGYYLYSLLHSHTKKSIPYTDSIIQIGEKSNNKYLLAKGYLQKGIQQYYLSSYSESLNNLVSAKKYFEQINNTFGLLVIRHYIVVLKNVKTNDKETTSDFKDNLNFIIKNNLDTIYRNQYFKSLLSLANAYSRNYKLDSAFIYFEKGILESKKSKSHFYSYFLHGYGINSFLDKDYKTSIDSLTKASSYLKNDNASLANTYLYIYESYRDLNKSNLGVKYLIKVDSIYQKNPTILYLAKDNYEYLKNYYKSINKPQEQLVYLTKMIEVDSLIEEKYANLNSEIVKKYEVPNLISEKKKLISDLKLTQNKQLTSIIILGVIILIVLSFLGYFISQNKKQNKRFNEIINQKSETNKNSKTTTTTINIPEDIYRNIIEKLNKFETSNKFVKQKYTLNKLAKELKTNSSYLSSVINSTKGGNFSHYQNSLKINYIIERLKTDQTLRAYTIKSIAEEAGFNTPQTFTKVFYKKTGIYPSYFIKKLKEE